MTALAVEVGGQAPVQRNMNNGRMQVNQRQIQNVKLSLSHVRTYAGGDLREHDQNEALKAEEAAEDSRCRRDSPEESESREVRRGASPGHRQEQSGPMRRSCGGPLKRAGDIH